MRTRSTSLMQVAVVAALGAASAACSAGAPPTLHLAPKAPELSPLPDVAAISEVARSPKAKVREASKDEALMSPAPEMTDASAALAGVVARCPAEMALVEGRVCVDRWEASLVRQSRSGESAWSPFMAIDGNEPYVRAVSKPGVIPQGYISGDQAMLACRASGKRLCTSEEWVRACRGPSQTTFPYGDERRAGACNDDIRALHPVIEVATALGIPSSDAWRDAMNNPLINQLPASLLRTGERVECTNAYGVFDMVGNLHEWIDDPEGTFRGGFYMDTSKNGDGCSYATRAHDVQYHDYSTGFRCCMDAERVE